MKKIVCMSVVISTLLGFLGCKSKETKFLERHSVVMYNTQEFQNFEAEASLKKAEAWNLQKKYAKESNIDLTHRLYFTVDEYYVFTAYAHPKVPDASTKGIWVHRNTGEVKYNEEGIFLKAYNHYEGEQ